MVFSKALYQAKLEAAFGHCIALLNSSSGSCTVYPCRVYAINSYLLFLPARFFPSTVLYLSSMLNLFQLQNFTVLPARLQFSIISPWHVYSICFLYLSPYCVYISFSSVLFLPAGLMASRVLYFFSLQGFCHLQSFTFFLPAGFMSARVLYSFSLESLCQLQFCSVSPWKVYVSYSSVQFFPNGEPYS